MPSQPPSVEEEVRIPDEYHEVGEQQKYQKADAQVGQKCATLFI
jgi:hypothetical protein